MLSLESEAEHVQGDFSSRVALADENSERTSIFTSPEQHDYILPGTLLPESPPGSRARVSQLNQEEEMAEAGYTLTVSDYIDRLSAAASDPEGPSIQELLYNYYGEFYDYNPDHSSYAENNSAANDSYQFVGDTVASTASCLSTISIRGIPAGVQAQDIPFREQDDPPDSPASCCPDSG